VDQIWIHSVGAASRVYPFSGYEDPVPRELVSTIYNRRFERTAHGLGAAAAGEVHGTRWVIHGRLEDRSVAHFRSDVLSPLTEEWAADGWMLGASVQSRFLERRLLVTLDGWYQTLAGEAESPGLEGVPFTADETTWSLAAQARLLPLYGWEAAGHVAVVRERRDRRDGIAEVQSDLAAWRPAAAIAVMRALGPLGIAVGAGMSEFNPSGSTPRSDEMGPVYQGWIAPELVVYATEAVSYAGMAGLRWRAHHRTALMVELRYDVTKPRRLLNGFVGARPSGTRERWSISAGIVLAER
jgi:hypothetical protein